MRRLTLRTRLTIGSTLLAVVLLAVVLLIARGVVSSMLDDIDTSLAQADLAPYREDVVAQPDEPLDDPAPGVLIRVVAPDGSVPIDTLPHELHEQLEHRAPEDAVLRLDADGVPYTVVAESVTTADGTWGLWAARSEQATTLALRSLDLVLLVGAGVLLIVYAFASWLLARAALTPVERMRRAAAELPADGDALLPVGPADDELAQLATTLNGFIAGIRASTSREKQMVSDAAHELRTPVAALRTRLELAREKSPADPALASELAAAERDATRLGELAANLLTLTRLEQTGPTEQTPGDQLETAIGDAVDRARMLHPHADIDYRVSLAPHDRLRVTAENIGRAVDNLLANAADATGGTGRILITLQRDGEDAVLAASDDGPGMPDDFLPRAFERFSRPDDARTRTAGGSGLGLALVRAVARGAGGDVTARNTRPGLRVEMRMPVCENSHPEGAPLTPAT